MSGGKQDTKPLLDGDTLSKMAPDLLQTCEETHAWLGEHEETLMKQWPADVTYLIDILAESIDMAKGEFPGTEPDLTYAAMGFSLPHVRKMMAVSKCDGTPSAILEDLKTTERMVMEIMSYVRAGEWTHTSLSNVVVIVQDVMKEVAKAAAARNERVQQTAWLRSCLDRDGHSGADITMQQIYAYTGEFMTAFPEDKTPRYSLRLARKQLEQETTVSEEDR